LGTKKQPQNSAGDVAGTLQELQLGVSDVNAHLTVFRRRRDGEVAVKIDPDAYDSVI